MRSWLPCLIATAIAYCGIPLLSLPAASAQVRQQSPSPEWLSPYREATSELMRAATADDFGWQRLAELTDTYGARLSGSENLTRAVAWAVDTMKKDGLQNVRAEPVTVPRWVRGAESGEIVEPPRHKLELLGLGGTVPTPPGGLEADVVVVTSFEQLRSRAREVRGKIVLFNAPFTNYSDAVSYRTGGARDAAQVGAVGVLVRATGPIGLRTAHTGAVNYGAEAPPIPAAAVSVEDANRIARLSARGLRVRVRLSLDAQYTADALSANVVGEIRGREKPDEIVLLGGHIDSWDVGAGASDDGVGCIITWEALRLMRKLGLQPRRTVRVVLWTNEENGLRGGLEYAEKHAGAAQRHIFALESDSGVFWPSVFGFSGSAAARSLMADIMTLVAPLGFTGIAAGGGGADIGPIARAGNVPTMAYIGEPSKYFAIHHTPADTVERIAPEDISRAAAAIAAIIYVVAEMPDRLPR